jgi:hypothetical protein
VLGAGVKRVPEAKAIRLLLPVSLLENGFVIQAGVPGTVD